MKKLVPVIFFLFIAAIVLNTPLTASSTGNPSQVRYGSENVDGINIFFREAGDPSNNAVVLLHGFPSSSHQYREVLSALGDEFYVVAPDYPGFGYSEKPSLEDYLYSFDNLAVTIKKFLDQKSIENYFLMVHDYGAPVGFRIATQNPEDIAGFVVMNGNAYEEGLSELSSQTLSQKRSPEDEANKINNFMSFEGIKWLYTTGARNPNALNPDGWHLDHAIISEPHVIALNLELLYDYPNNLSLYKNWQKYLRETQPPMLIVWGKNDPIFPESGAAAYKKDVKNIDYNVYDTGHFPLEEYAPEIVDKMSSFLQRHSIDEDLATFDDQDAKEIIAKVVEANGGVQALQNLKDVEFDYTFRVKENNKVDVSKERYIFEDEISYADYIERQVYANPQMSGSHTQFFDGTNTVSKMDGKIITEQQPAYIGNALRKTNYYWFAMMFKLLDPGVNHKLLPTRNVNGIPYKIVEMTFGENVGEASDRFILYINPTTYRIDQFLYTATGFGVTEPSLMKVQYEEIDGIYLTTYRKYAPADWDGNVTSETWTEQITENIKFNNGFDLENIKSSH